MWLTTLFLLFLRAVALPLDPFSTITLRTLSTPSSNGPPSYKELILEEWSLQNQLIQTWTPKCTLAGISTESYTEGLLRSRYPYLDGIWFLCRDVPIGAPFSYSPAPVMIMNLGEFGDLNIYSTDNTTYPNGTTVNSVYPFYNETLEANIFYLMGGAAPAVYPNPAKPLVPRIRVDYVPRAPPPPANFAGPLTYITTAVTPSGLTIMTDSLYMPSMVTNFSITSPVVYLVGNDNSLPAAQRSIVTPSLFTFTLPPQMLSFWSFPLQDIMWYTYFSLVSILARTNFNSTDPTRQTQTFALPTSVSSGTLGGASWRIVSAKYDMSNMEIIYVSNGTMIMSNTLENLNRGLPYTQMLIAPSGWKFLDAYARSPNTLPPIFPSPSAAPTRTSSPTVTRSLTKTPSGTPTASGSPSGTRTPTTTATTSITSSPSLSATTSAILTGSPSITPTSGVTASPSMSTSVSQTATSSITPSAAAATSSTSPSKGTISSATSTITSAATSSSIPTTSVSASITPSSSGSAFAPANANTGSSYTTNVAVGAGVGIAALAVLGAFGLFAFRRIPGFRTFYTRNFGAKAPKIPTTSRGKPKSESKEVEINQNPFLLSQARAAQLREMQDNMTLPASRPRSLSKTKKEFTPNMTGNTIREVRVKGMKGLSV